MRRYVLVLAIASSIALVWLGSRRSAADPETDPAGEPISGDPIAPSEPPSVVGKSAFEPYGVGDAGPEDGDPIWSYEALRPEEREVVDRGREPAQASQWSATHDRYKQAVAARAAQARAEAAAIALAIDVGEGVVP